MLQSKIKMFYYTRSEHSLQSTDMIEVIEIHSKSLKYSKRKQKEAWKTPISYDSSVGSRNGCRPLRTSKMKQLLSLVADVAFISSEYISEHVRITASET